MNDMKFCEAMDKLKAGSRVTRNPWREGVYFKMVDADVKSYQPKLSPFVYNEDIMVSDGWLVEGQPEAMTFCEAVPFLQQGLHAKLNTWDETYIFLDRQSKSLVVHTMDTFPFLPDFESFLSTDWIEL